MNPSTETPIQNSTNPPLDRHFWLAIAFATLVLVVRAILICRAHSEIMDSQFHLRSGLMLLTGNPAGIINTGNDAPLGQELMALPVVVLGMAPDLPINDATWPMGISKPGEMSASEPAMSPERATQARTLRRQILYGQRLSPRAILILIGVWKSLLFVPAICVIFQWCRQLYGVRGGWLAVALVLVDPTFAAHIPILALDTLGVEGIVIACYFLWLYFREPSTRRLIIASIAVAVAMMLKHTAAIMPMVALLMAAWYWVVRPWSNREPLRWQPGQLVRAALIMLLAIWILTGFDWSIPSHQFQGALPRVENPSRLREVGFAMMDRPWPAGMYVGRFVSGWITSQYHHRAFLFGDTKLDGWWYYFPVIATYKVPLVVGVLFLLAIASFLWVPWRKEETSLLIPLICWAALLMTSRLNIGFRHFLPAYVFMLMLAARCVADLSRRWPIIVASVCIALAAIDIARFHPDYLSYINLPRRQWWTQITESNVDWGQGLAEAAEWIDRHPQGDRQISIAPRWDRQPASFRWHLGDRAELLDRGATPPTHGILIISPIWVTGVYDVPFPNPYEFLHDKQPIDVIGHSLLVYDLDELAGSAKTPR